MSKRFGRNQKRHMREQLTKAQADEALAQHQLTGALSRARDLDFEIREAQRRLGQYTYALHPKVLRVSRDPTPWGAEAIHVSRPEAVGFPVDQFSNGFEWRTTRAFIPREPLPVMVAKSKLDPSDGSVHIRVRYADGQWGYGISREVFQHEDHEELVRLVSSELAEVIVNDMRSGRVR